MPLKAGASIPFASSFPRDYLPFRASATPTGQHHGAELLPEVDLGLEIGARVGARQGFFQFDAALAHQVVERTVETQHAALGAGADRLLHADQIALLDKRRDVRSVNHD